MYLTTYTSENTSPNSCVRQSQSNPMLFPTSWAWWDTYNEVYWSRSISQNYIFPNVREQPHSTTNRAPSNFSDLYRASRSFLHWCLLHLALIDLVVLGSAWTRSILVFHITAETHSSGSTFGEVWKRIQLPQRTHVPRCKHWIRNKTRSTSQLFKISAICFCHGPEPASILCRESLVAQL